jgi:hypothetical protein
VPPVLIGVAVSTTLVANGTVLALGGPAKLSGQTADPAPGRYVSVSAEAMRPADPLVAPLERTRTPHLLAAAKGTLSADVVERIRKLREVAALEVVDAAQTQVAGRRLGLLGVDPSTFRAFTPPPTAESDQLWRSVANGDLVVGFGFGRSGGFELGAEVTAGSAARQGRVRVGAYAALGITDVDAVVSRTQAQTLGLPVGNALLVSARKTSPEKLSKTLRKVLPRGSKIAVTAPPTRTRTVTQRRQPRAEPRVTHRPDGAGSGGSTPVTGNSMTPRMRAVLIEINNRFGPFPVIGCLRPGDPLDHGSGNACDFMEGTTGRMPSPSALAHGDQVAQYAVSNAGRLGIKYVIWKQSIWNTGIPGGWRRMEDRGSITQNHFDHVHISVY